MRHSLLIALLVFGAIAGFGSGFARLHHERHRQSGDFCWYRGGLEQRAAQACTRAAIELMEQRKTAGAGP